MSITVIIGTPGAGKSYVTVKDYILKHVTTGRLVITNIPLNIDAFPGVTHEFIQILNIDDYPDNRVPFDSVEDYQSDWRNDQNQGPFIVIDECQEVFAGQANPKKDLLDFIAKHRHHGIDILLISQDFKYLHARIKANIEDTVKLTKLATLGFGNGYMQDAYIGLPASGKRYIYRKKHKYDPKYFPYYKSHTMSVGSVQEAEKLNVRNPMRTLVKLAGLGVILAVGFSIYNFKNMGSNLAGSTIAKETVDQSSSDRSKTTVPISYSGNRDQNGRRIKDTVEEAVNRYKKLPRRDALDLTVETVQRPPFYNYHFSVESRLTSKDRDIWHFRIKNIDTGVFLMVSSLDLGKMGYAVRALANCVAIIDHPYNEGAVYAHCESQQNVDRVTPDVPKSPENETKSVGIADVNYLQDVKTLQ